MISSSSSKDSYDREEEEEDDLALGIEEFMDERELDDDRVVVVVDDSVNNDNTTYNSDEGSAGSIRMYHKQWPSSEQNDYMEDKGWEDWDDDHRRALGKAHQRTLETLEEASGRRMDYARSSMLGAMTEKPTRKDPKGQILPRRYSSHEVNSKKRQSYGDSWKKPHKYVFFTRNCILLSAVGFLCFTAFIAVHYYVVFPPPGAFAGTVLRTEGRIGNGGKDPTSPDQSFVPLINRNTEVINLEENERNNVLSSLGVLRKLAFIIGNFFIPQNEDSPKQATVITVQDLEFLNRIQDELPKYDKLYSTVGEPTADIQPVLWDIGRSGSGTLKQILTYCFKLVLSSEMALNHEEAQLLEIYSTEDNTGHYVNVNTETLEGLERARRVGMVDSNLVQVISTPYIAEAAQLFADKTRSGRIFVLLRHPVEQAHSNFLFRKTLPEGHPERLPEELSLSQYVESDLLPTNSLTRALLNVTENDGVVLTDLHILGAQKILEEQVLVGLLDSFDESVHMFAKYFGWGDTPATSITNTAPSSTASTSINQGTMNIDPVCIANFETSRDNRDAHEQLPDDTTLEWKTIADRNYADIQLYIFARSLYERQQKGLLLSMRENSSSSNNL